MFRLVKLYISIIESYCDMQGVDDSEFNENSFTLDEIEENLKSMLKNETKEHLINLRVFDDLHNALYIIEDLRGAKEENKPSRPIHQFFNPYSAKLQDKSYQAIRELDDLGNQMTTNLTLEFWRDALERKKYIGDYMVIFNYNKEKHNDVKVGDEIYITFLDRVNRKLEVVYIEENNLNIILGRKI